MTEAAGRDELQLRLGGSHGGVGRAVGGRGLVPFNQLPTPGGQEPGVVPKAGGAGRGFNLNLDRPAVSAGHRGPEHLQQPADPQRMQLHASQQDTLVQPVHSQRWPCIRCHPLCYVLL